MPRVVVDVEQARRHVKIRYVHDPASVVRGEVLFDRHNFSLLDGHIANFVETVGRIDNVATLQQKIIVLAQNPGRSDKASPNAKPVKRCFMIDSLTSFMPSR